VSVLESRAVEGTLKLAQDIQLLRNVLSFKIIFISQLLYEKSAGCCLRTKYRFAYIHREITFHFLTEVPD